MTDKDIQIFAVRLFDKVYPTYASREGVVFEKVLKYVKSLFNSIQRSAGKSGQETLMDENEFFQIYLEDLGTVTVNVIEAGYSDDFIQDNFEGTAELDEILQIVSEIALEMAELLFIDIAFI